MAITNTTTMHIQMLLEMQWIIFHDFFLLHFSWDEKKISESNRPGTTSGILVNNRLLVYHIYPVAANLSLLLSNNSYKHQIPLSRFQKSRSRAKLLLNSPRLGDHMPRLRDLNEILASRKWLLSRRLEVGGSFFFLFQYFLLLLARFPRDIL